MLYKVNLVQASYSMYNSIIAVMILLFEYNIL